MPEHEPVFHPEQDIFLHLTEYDNKEDFDNRILQSIKDGKGVLVGVFGPLSSGKTTEIQERHLALWQRLNELQVEKVPDPGLVVTYEGSEKDAQHHLRLQSAGDVIIYDPNNPDAVIYNQREQLNIEDKPIELLRRKSVGRKVEDESNIDLLLNLLDAFRSIKTDPSKKIVFWDGPANGYAFKKHNYGREALRTLLSFRHLLAPTIDVFLIYKLGDTEMYKKAPRDRDALIRKQRKIGYSWGNDYGGGDAQMVYKRLRKKVNVVDVLTGKPRKGTYAELIVELASQYPESNSDTFIQDVQKIYAQPEEFSPEVQRADKIRIRGELADMIKPAPESHRGLHLLFDYVTYDKSKKNTLQS